jgi:uncharacterized metal-binding protein
MVDLPKKKVGIVACSGEELPEGTITRLAALRVLENLRPNDTVTICLPLFLAGGEGDRAFARFYPTISVDGCALRCAEKATAKYSHKPAASILVQELVEGNKLDQLAGRRRLNEAGMQAVEITAEKIAGTVDELLGKQWNRKQGELVPTVTNDDALAEETSESVYATCACGSGIPVQNVMIAGERVTIVGLPLLLQQFAEAGKAPSNENLDELMDTVKIYNLIAKEEEPVYREGIWSAYKKFWFKERVR